MRTVRVWQQGYAKLKVSAAHEDVCAMCVNFRNQHQSLAVHNTCSVAARDLDEWENEDIFGILDNGSTDRDRGEADTTIPEDEQLGGLTVRPAPTFAREGRGAPVVPVVEGVGEKLCPATATRGSGASGDGGRLCRGNKRVIPSGSPSAAHATGRVEMPQESTGLRSPLPGSPSAPPSGSVLSSDAGNVEPASSGISAEPDASPVSTQSAPHAGGSANGKRRPALPYLCPKKWRQKGR